MENRDNYFSIGQVAQILDLSTNTIKRWYKWYENDDYEKPIELKLPKYYFLDKRKTKFFLKSDLAILMQFRDDMQGKYRGIMSDFNACWQWGQYGTEKLMREKQKEDKGE
jgi:hypothetical protein